MTSSSASGVGAGRWWTSAEAWREDREDISPSRPSGVFIELSTADRPVDGVGVLSVGPFWAARDMKERVEASSEDWLRGVVVDVDAGNKDGRAGAMAADRWRKTDVRGDGWTDGADTDNVLVAGEDSEGAGRLRGEVPAAESWRADRRLAISIGLSVLALVRALNWAVWSPPPAVELFEVWEFPRGVVGVDRFRGVDG